MNHTALAVLVSGSAYWVGFLAADGCIRKVGPNRRIISVSLATRDRDHVEKWRGFLQSSRKILDTRSVRKGTVCYQSQLIVNSRQLYDDLVRYGFCDRKSYKDIDYLSFLPSKEVYWPFLIGYFDGDGSVYQQHAKGDVYCYFMGTKSFMDHAREFMVEQKIDHNYRVEGKLWRIEFSASRGLKEFVVQYRRMGERTLVRKREILSLVC